MKKYKGYYIDNICFKSKKDIDEFIKSQAIDRYKQLSKLFAKNPSMEISSIMSDLSLKLHDEFNLSYSEIEALEIC